jgi:beta-glucosidase
MSHGVFPNWVILEGEHAPGKQDKKLSLDVYHHLNLAHGLAVKKFRELKTGGVIGATLNLMLPRPSNNDPQNIEAANRVAITESRILLDPMYGRGYPTELTELFKGYSFPVLDGDMDLIAEPTDFIGINYYSEFAVKWDENSPGNVGFDHSYQEKTDMDWPIVPQGLYRMMDYLRTNYNNPDIYITENGCAYRDEPNSDMTRCHDPKRIEYLKQHFAVIKKAIENGIRVKGYYLWSFIDNFEWAYGYTKRFGIVYCDYKTQKRIPKDSYYYYREVIAGFEDI